LTRHSDRESLVIRAAVLRKRGGPLEIETLKMEGPRDDEVLTRIVASGVCRTDIDLCEDWNGPPVVLGHEGAGVVEWVGKNVKGFTRGDHVALSYQSCGACRECRKGRPAHCERFYDLNFGFMRPDGGNALQGSGVRGHFFGQSSFATHALATERNLVKVDKKLPLDLLAPLGCGFQTGAGTIMNTLNVSKGASVAILGAGSVGLAAVMAARIVEAGSIIAVDLNPKRLELAQELGATHTIDNRREDIAARIADITGSGVDYALEITGEPAMERLATGILNPQGVAAFIAAPGGERSLSQGRKVVGVIQGDATPQRFIPQLIELHLAGRFPFDRLLSFYEFSEINKAISDAKQGNAIKPVLRIGKA